VSRYGSEGETAMDSDIEGTWEEVLRKKEREVQDFERRIEQSRYKELKLWKDDQLFTVRKGIPGGPDRWDIWTPRDTYFGASADEVLQQAEQFYPEIYSWLSEFNDR
jgi:hypothetical protein